VESKNGHIDSEAEIESQYSVFDEEGGKVLKGASLLNLPRMDHR
jgi:hypothetical protein